MAAGITLTETAYITRKIINWSGVGILAIFFIWLGAKWAIETWKQMHPPPPPPATVGFGLLPPQPFPEATPPTLTLSLETTDGALPVMPNMSKVYFMPKSSSSFMDLESAKAQAASLGFTTEAIKKSDTVYEWQSDGGFKFTTDIITHEFSYTYDYSADQDLLRPTKMPGTEEVAQLTRSFIGKAISLPEDLASGIAKFVMYRYSGSQMIPVLSLSEAEFMQIGLLRHDYDGLPVLPSEPKKGSVWALFAAAGGGQKQFVEAEYKYLAVDAEKYETYPLKPVSNAWQELAAGKYYLAQLDEQHGSSVSIKRVYLAYFDPPKLVGFMEPMYVFEGDDNFMGYVSAIEDDWIAK